MIRRFQHKDMALLLFQQKYLNNAVKIKVSMIEK